MEILIAARDAASADYDFLTAAQGRIDAEISAIRQRYQQLRSDVVRAIVGGDAEKQGSRSELMVLADSSRLLTDAYTKIDVFSLPDAAVALETAQLHLRKHEADLIESKAKEELHKMKAGIPEGAKLEVKGTDSYRRFVEAQRELAQIADAFERLAKQKDENAARAQATLISGFLQLR